MTGVLRYWGTASVTGVLGYLLSDWVFGYCFSDWGIEVFTSVIVYLGTDFSDWGIGVLRSTSVTGVLG